MSSDNLRVELDAVLRQRGIVFPSNEIHSGPAGFFDLGPVGCALKQQVLALWRQHFVVREGMLEIETPCLTPGVVLETSGHVKRFTDWMVHDMVDGTPHRADKLLEQHCEHVLANSTTFSPYGKEAFQQALREAGSMNGDQLAQSLTRLQVKSPAGNMISLPPVPFNLMFSTQIGPAVSMVKKQMAYLRPETAQGIFVNFLRLLQQNGGHMPFAAAQIGTAFRNEIAPRQGLLRVREFTLAEIEHFCDPEDKRHAQFSSVATCNLPLLSRQDQIDGNMKAKQIAASEAVTSGTIANETLAYYVVRTFQFLLACGIHVDKLRFRQHQANEMAHYASDCWDAEILTSYGWTECVGIADRAAYDLNVHSNATGQALVAHATLPEPKEVQEVSLDVKHAVMGKALGKHYKQLVSHLKSLALAEALALERVLADCGFADVQVLVGGELVSFHVSREMVSFHVVTRVELTRTYTPHVIEPAFGIGRIMYAMLEHAYYVRPHTRTEASNKTGVRRAVLGLHAAVAPTKLTILSVVVREAFEPMVAELRRAAVLHQISYKVDNSASSIGRRYARADEIGTPYAVVVDDQTLSTADATVTLRERDSMQQIRLPLDATAPLVACLCNGTLAWSDARMLHKQVV